VGTPDNPDDWVQVVIGEWGRRYGTLYIAPEIWTHLRPHARDFTFYVPDRGRCRIYFDGPVNRLQPRSAV
jgi:hypothetical protein